MFDGWFDEVKDQLESLPYAEKLSKFKILAPINNPPKILCLAFNYLDHAKEQNLSPPKDPVVVMKPRTALCGNEDEIKVPEFVTQLDYEVELADPLLHQTNHRTKNPLCLMVKGHLSCMLFLL